MRNQLTIFSFLILAVGCGAERALDVGESGGEGALDVGESAEGEGEGEGEGEDEGVAESCEDISGAWHWTIGLCELPLVILAPNACVEQTGCGVVITTAGSVTDANVRGTRVLTGADNTTCVFDYAASNPTFYCRGVIDDETVTCKGFGQRTDLARADRDLSPDIDAPAHFGACAP